MYPSASLHSARRVTESPCVSLLLAILPIAGEQVTSEQSLGLSTYPVR